MERITKITKNDGCTWPKNEYIWRSIVMTYLTENAMKLMEQFFELKLLQSKNTLHKFKKISQNHSANQC